MKQRVSINLTQLIEFTHAIALGVQQFSVFEMPTAMPGTWKAFIARATVASIAAGDIGSAGSEPAQLASDT
ncbi:MAG: hypothetical protein ABI356_01335 [Steroidobacteraceae bacterium]